MAHQTHLDLGLCRGWREPWAEISSAVNASELFSLIKALLTPTVNWNLPKFLAVWRSSFQKSINKVCDFCKGQWLSSCFCFSCLPSWYTPFFSQIPVKCTVTTCLLDRSIFFPTRGIFCFCLAKIPSAGKSSTCRWIPCWVFGGKVVGQEWDGLSQNWVGGRLHHCMHLERIGSLAPAFPCSFGGAQSESSDHSCSTVLGRNL